MRQLGRMTCAVFAACTMACALGAWAKEVTFNLNLTNGFGVYGIPLVTGSESATTMKLNDLGWDGLQGVNFGSDDSFMETATQIQVPIERDGKFLGYNVYYYLSNAWSEKQGVAIAGWADACGDYADVEISPTLGVWIKSPSIEGIAVTVKGYPVTTAMSKSCPEGTFALCANPFAENINLNDASRFVAEGIVGVDYGDGGFVDTASVIEVASRNRYYYLNDAWMEDYRCINGWADKWGNAAGTLLSGAGFWVKGRTGAFNLTFKPQ